MSETSTPVHGKRTADNRSPLEMPTAKKHREQLIISEDSDTDQTINDSMSSATSVDSSLSLKEGNMSQLKDAISQTVETPLEYPADEATTGEWGKFICGYIKNTNDSVNAKIDKLVQENKTLNDRLAKEDTEKVKTAEVLGTITKVSFNAIKCILRYMCSKKQTEQPAGSASYVMTSLICIITYVITDRRLTLVLFLKLTGCTRNTF